MNTENREVVRPSELSLVSMQGKEVVVGKTRVRLSVLSLVDS